MNWQQEFETKARQLCREHGLPESEAQMKVLGAALRQGGLMVLGSRAEKLKAWTDNFVANRERGNAPQ